METAQRLARMTTEFYETNAASFSDTRSYPWSGWDRCLEHIVARSGDAEGVHASAAVRVAGRGADAQRPSKDEETHSRTSLRILDLACGNLRFERHAAAYLREHGACAAFDAVDGCAALTTACGKEDPQVRVSILDILEALFADRLDEELPHGSVDAAVCFGFMHHVPGFAMRVRLLRTLAGRLRPGGVMAVSFWRFMDDARIAAKASALTAALTGLPDDGGPMSLEGGVSKHHEDGAVPTALPDGLCGLDLEENDRLLGWRDSTETLRYCHHFTEEEIAALCAELEDEVTPLDRFCADGKNGALNAYIVFRKKERRYDP